MKVEQMLQLIDAMSKSGLTEFKYEEDGVKLSLKKTDGKEKSAQIIVQPQEIQAAVQPVSQTAQVQAAGVQAEIHPQEAAADGESISAEGNIVKSPLVGTFYAAASEEAEPFVKVGDAVKEGQVLAIVEAMKLMNEIESDFSGTVAEILVENGQAVEYGQPLFVIR